MSSFSAPFRLLCSFMLMGGIVLAQTDSAGLAVVSQGANRRWQVFDAGSGTLIKQGGASAEEGVLSLARWRSDSLELVSIAQQSNGLVRAVLLADGGERSVTLTDGFFAIAGGDLNGSGLADLVVIRTRNARRTWNVYLDPFSGNSLSGDAARRFSWGRAGDIPFYAALDEGREWLGLLRRNRSGAYRRMILRDVVSEQLRFVKLARVQRGVLKVRPISYMGQSAIIVFKRDRYLIFSLSAGSARGSLLFSGRGKFADASFSIGDYLDLPGDELAVGRGAEEVEILHMPTGISRFVRLAEGDLVGRFGLGRFEQGQPSSGGSSSGSSANVAGGCALTLNPNDGPNGFLWKESEYGGLVVLTVQKFDSVVIVKSGRIIDGPLEYSGVGNGNRHHWRNRGRSATDYPDGIVLVGRKGTTNTCWPLNPAERID